MSEKMHYYIFNIIIPGWNQTLVMFCAVVILSSIIGLIVAIILYNSSEVGLSPNKRVNTILGTLINLLRSLPVTILIVLLVPLARLIVGKPIGVKAGIFYLTFAAFPFVARVFEGNLREVDRKIIEMAKSLGASESQILIKFVLHDAIPSMVLGLTFSAILISGYIAVAGAVGAGGLGEVALLYGYRTYNHFIMNVCVIIMAAFAGIIQFTGNFIYKKIK